MRIVRFGLIFALLSLAAQAEVVDSQTINVDGQYTQPASAAQKLKQLRKKLEVQNEMMVRKQIETLRFKQEVELMKKMKQIMDQQLEALNSIQ